MSMTEDFFLDDEAGVAAADMLRQQLDLFPETLTWMDGRIDSCRFTIRADLLRDAVTAATLKLETDDLEFCVCLSEKNFRLFTTVAGVQLWVSIARGESQPTRQFSFTMSQTLLRRLAGVAAGDFIGQIVQGPPGLDADMLRVRMGTARLKLTAYAVHHFPEIHAAEATPEIVKFDPVRLQRSLRSALAMSPASASGQVIRVHGGCTYTGTADCFVTVDDEFLGAVDLAVTAKDARLLARVLGRMRKGEAHMWSDGSAYIFEDKLLTCTVQKAKGQAFPLDRMRAAQPDRTFALVSQDLQKLAMIAALARPRFIILHFPATSDEHSQTAEPAKVAVHATTPGNPNECRSVLQAWPEGGGGADKTVRVNGRPWLAATTFVDHNCRAQWHLMRQGQILKMTVTREDTTLCVYLPEYAAE